MRDFLVQERVQQGRFPDVRAPEEAHLGTGIEVHSLKFRSGPEEGRRLAGKELRGMLELGGSGREGIPVVGEGGGRDV